MNAQPLVSVLMSVYNAGAYLRPAVESVLRQTYRDWELLIVDDGSTDGCIDTIADLRDERVRVIRQDNAGKSAALNRALGEARGEFYAIQDGDDLSYPRRLEAQAACLASRPELAACFTGHDLILGGRTVAPRLRAKGVEECRADIERMRMPAHDPTVMYRRSLVADLAYEPSLRIGQGLDYILRVGERHPMVVLGECLYSYRAHEGSVTRQDYRRRQAFIQEVTRRACRRRGIDPEPHVRELAVRADRPRPRDLDNNLAAHLMESTLDLRRHGQRWRALRTAWQSLAMHPLDPHYGKALVYAVVPMRWVELWRGRRRGPAAAREAYG